MTTYATNDLLELFVGIYVQVKKDERQDHVDHAKKLKQTVSNARLNELTEGK